ncbi:hypothetical protein PTTG_30770 [Puccinia triticina 1-1 BBBD Race 1]|uniref:Uncharacterized protein n=1 Tax=Puccinia triticina (isolate 1-1 / race 1 (BBBD)) TaxID=630390 RepID=A0A180FXF7_PUCT1|nr:hypothetical protein PTTG_30770 [Puccinia triticina 1-1 BBBD Race 1]
MSFESPIFVPEDYSSKKARATELEAAIRVLSPNGISPVFEDSFTQTEFNTLETNIFRDYIVFCHKNLPRNHTEVLARARIYVKFSTSFAKVNIHRPEPIIKQEDPMASGSNSNPSSGSSGFRFMSPVYFGHQGDKTAPFSSSSS